MRKVLGGLVLIIGIALIWIGLTFDPVKAQDGAGVSWQCYPVAIAVQVLEAHGYTRVREIPLPETGSYIVIARTATQLFSTALMEGPFGPCMVLPPMPIGTIIAPDGRPAPTIEKPSGVGI